jgi:glycosyltransferase Alg8
VRNGARGVALGPHRAGLFIWWCLLDQRIAIWTTLVAPALALSGAAVTTPWFIVGYGVWILATRLMQSVVLWSYAREADPLFPLLLYVNQVINAVVKLVCMVRLSKQRWTNRGDQRAGFERSLSDQLRQIVAGYIMTVSIAGLVLMVVVFAGRAFSPTIYTLSTLLDRF